MRFRGKARSERNPRYCNSCNKFIHKHPGGAEVEMTLLFVDIRGSTALAETMSATEFSAVMDRFFKNATKALIESDGFVVEFRGDCVAGVYPPGFSGANHAQKAIQGARLLLGDLQPRTRDGRDIPIGVGVHTGVVYIGTVSGSEGSMQEITVLGDHVNTAARLSQVANPGEALISKATYEACECREENLVTKRIALKGKSTERIVHVLSSAG